MDSGPRGLISKPCATAQALLSIVVGSAARTSVICLRPPVPRPLSVKWPRILRSSLAGVAQVHLIGLCGEGESQCRRSVPGAGGGGVHSPHLRLLYGSAYGGPPLSFRRAYLQRTCWLYELTAHHRAGMAGTVRRTAAGLPRQLQPRPGQLGASKRTATFSSAWRDIPDFPMTAHGPRTPPPGLLRTPQTNSGTSLLHVQLEQEAGTQAPGWFRGRVSARGPSLEVALGDGCARVRYGSTPGIGAFPCHRLLPNRRRLRRRDRPEAKSAGGAAGVTCWG